MTEQRPVAIRFSGLKKQYRLGVVGHGTLREDLQSWWAKARGKEDPNSIIGTDSRLVGQKFMALNGIDLTIYQGEAVGIIGSNGAGKSTLLKLLAQVTTPSEGEIDIYGRVASLLEIGTGFNGELTGRENVYMNGAILGMSKKEIASVFDSIVEFSEVGEFIDTPVKRYSSGMYIRLAFAVAAHLQSEILVCDEILAVGDMAYQNKCLDKMRQAATTEGRTVLYVSHNMNTIRRLCDRCVVLNEGTVIFDGEVDKAIAVYMQHALSENEVDMDLREKPRNRGELERDVTMEHLVLLGKDVPIYEENETLNLRLTVTAGKPLERVSLRLTLRTDGDMGLGTAWSKEISLPAGTQELLLSMPLTPLTKGCFYASIGLYQSVDLGWKATLDHITRAFRIELPGVPVWNNNAHGYLRLPEIRLETETIQDGILK